jgi:cell division protein FtsB
MLEKINKLWSRYQKHPYVQQLKDVRVIGLIAFCAIALLVAWSGLGAIQSNYVLQKQIARLQQENQVKELENTNLKLKNQYYNTDQYLELQARRQFGRAAPGETLILVPKGVAMSRTVDLPAEEAESKEQPDPEKPTYQKNFEAWIEFFFHRS